MRRLLHRHWIFSFSDTQHLPGCTDSKFFGKGARRHFRLHCSPVRHFFAQQREPILLQIAKYSAAIVANSILASLLLMAIHLVLANVLVAKLVSDVISVGLSFFIARSYVFRAHST